MDATRSMRRRDLEVEVRRRVLAAAWALHDWLRYRYQPRGEFCRLRWIEAASALGLTADAITAMSRRAAIAADRSQRAAEVTA